MLCPSAMHLHALRVVHVADIVSYTACYDMV